jgi:hypothetical protein
LTQHIPPEMASTFNLCFCADVNGIKRNYELAFERKPDDLAYLVEQLEFVFRKECFDASNYRSFAIDFIVFFEDSAKRWRPLEHPQQLTDNEQLYIFQTTLAKESINEIPQPTKLLHVPEVPRQSQRSVHNPGYSVVDLEKVEAVFKELDINNSESISITEMLHGFTVAGVDFTADAVKKLFDKSDANGDGEISWDEFRIFADLFPNTTETLYWRLCKTTMELSARSLETTDELKRVRQREHELKKELAEAQRAAQLLEQRVRQERYIAREADPRRRMLELEEQDLINKEFALQFHRDMVIQAEQQFSETAVRFDHAAVSQGSPRRARFLQN